MISNEQTFIVSGVIFWTLYDVPYHGSDKSVDPSNFFESQNILTKKKKVQSYDYKDKHEISALLRKEKEFNYTNLPDFV